MWNRGRLRSEAKTQTKEPNDFNDESGPPNVEASVVVEAKTQQGYNIQTAVLAGAGVTAIAH